jgi:hypothetical protein
VTAAAPAGLTLAKLNIIAKTTKTDIIRNLFIEISLCDWWARERLIMWLTYRALPNAYNYGVINEASISQTNPIHNGVNRVLGWSKTG